MLLLLAEDELKLSCSASSSWCPWGWAGTKLGEPWSQGLALGQPGLRPAHSLCQGRDLITLDMVGRRCHSLQSFMKKGLKATVLCISYRLQTWRVKKHSKSGFSQPPDIAPAATKLKIEIENWNWKFSAQMGRFVHVSEKYITWHCALKIKYGVSLISSQAGSGGKIRASWINSKFHY